MSDKPTKKGKSKTRLGFRKKSKSDDKAKSAAAAAAAAASKRRDNNNDDDDDDDGDVEPSVDDRDNDDNDKPSKDKDVEDDETAKLLASEFGKGACVRVCVRVKRIDADNLLRSLVRQ